MNISTSLATAELPTSLPTSFTSIMAQFCAVFLLGLVILYATGFSEASVAHNAAHDTRHANGRPCH